MSCGAPVPQLSVCANTAKPHTILSPPDSPQTPPATGATLATHKLDALLSDQPSGSVAQSASAIQTGPVTWDVPGDSDGCVAQQPYQAECLSAPQSSDGWDDVFPEDSTSAFNQQQCAGKPFQVVRAQATLQHGCQVSRQQPRGHRQRAWWAQSPFCDLDAKVPVSSEPWVASQPVPLPPPSSWGPQFRPCGTPNNWHSRPYQPYQQGGFRPQAVCGRQGPTHGRFGPQQQGFLRPQGAYGRQAPQRGGFAAPHGAQSRAPAVARGRGRHSAGSFGPRPPPPPPGKNHPAAQPSILQSAAERTAASSVLAAAAPAAPAARVSVEQSVGVSVQQGPSSSRSVVVESTAARVAVQGSSSRAVNSAGSVEPTVVTQQCTAVKVAVASSSRDVDMRSNRSTVDMTDTALPNQAPGRKPSDADEQVVWAAGHPQTRPTYSAVFLDSPSRAVLLAAVPAKHMQIRAHHVTLIFRPTLEQLQALPLGQAVELSCYAEVDDTRCQAVVVELPELLAPIAPLAPHVTVSVQPGTPAKQAGNLVGLALADEAGADCHLQVLTAIKLSGRVGVEMPDDSICYSMEEVRSHLLQSQAGLLSTRSTPTTRSRPARPQGVYVPPVPALGGGAAESPDAAQVPQPTVAMKHAGSGRPEAVAKPLPVASPAVRGAAQDSMPEASQPPAGSRPAKQAGVHGSPAAKTELVSASSQPPPPQVPSARIVPAPQDMSGSSDAVPPGPDALPQMPFASILPGPGSTDNAAADSGGIATSSSGLATELCWTVDSFVAAPKLQQPGPAAQPSTSLHLPDKPKQPVDVQQGRVSKGAGGTVAEAPRPVVPATASPAGAAAIAEAPGRTQGSVKVPTSSQPPHARIQSLAARPSPSQAAQTGRTSALPHHHVTKASPAPRRTALPFPALKSIDDADLSDDDSAAIQALDALIEASRKPDPEFRQRTILQRDPAARAARQQDARDLAQAHAEVRMRRRGIGRIAAPIMHSSQPRTQSSVDSVPLRAGADASNALDNSNMDELASSSDSSEAADASAPAIPSTDDILQKWLDAGNLQPSRTPSPGASPVGSFSGLQASPLGRPAGQQQHSAPVSAQASPARQPRRVLFKLPAGVFNLAVGAKPTASMASLSDSDNEAAALAGLVSSTQLPSGPVPAKQLIPAPGEYLGGHQSLDAAHAGLSLQHAQHAQRAAAVSSPRSGASTTMAGLSAADRTDVRTRSAPLAIPTPHPSVLATQKSVAAVPVRSPSAVASQPAAGASSSSPVMDSMQHSTAQQDSMQRLRSFYMEAFGHDAEAADAAEVQADADERLAVAQLLARFPGLDRNLARTALKDAENDLQAATRCLAAGLEASMFGDSAPGGSSMLSAVASPAPAQATEQQPRSSTLSTLGDWLQPQAAKKASAATLGTPKDSRQTTPAVDTTPGADGSAWWLKSTTKNQTTAATHPGAAAGAEAPDAASSSTPAAGTDAAAAARDAAGQLDVAGEAAPAAAQQAQQQGASSVLSPREWELLMQHEKDPAAAVAAAVASAGEAIGERRRMHEAADATRRTAYLHRTARSIYFEAAKSAYEQGDKDLALELATKGREHNALFHDTRRQANETAFAGSNLHTVNRVKMDLHGLHVDEALRKLEKYLFNLKELGQPGGMVLQVVTGVGKHSVEGRARILPAVLGYLQLNGYYYSREPDNPGVVNIRI